MEAEVVFQLARVFEQVYLRVAVGAERERDARGEERVRGHDAVAEVALGRRARADRRPRACERARLSGRDVDGVDAGEARV